MSKKVKIHYIAKIEKEDNKVLLFLPDSSANKGNVQCFAPLEGHMEASLAYYAKECRTPDATEMDAVTRVVESYAKAYKCEMLPLQQLRRKSILFV